MGLSVTDQFILWLAILSVLILYSAVRYKIWIQEVKKQKEIKEERWQTRNLPPAGRSEY